MSVLKYVFVAIGLIATSEAFQRLADDLSSVGGWYVLLIGLAMMYPVLKPVFGWLLGLFKGLKQRGKIKPCAAASGVLHDVTERRRAEASTALR